MSQSKGNGSNDSLKRATDLMNVNHLKGRKQSRKVTLAVNNAFQKIRQGCYKIFFHLNVGKSVIG